MKVEVTQKGWIYSKIRKPGEQLVLTHPDHFSEKWMTALEPMPEVAEEPIVIQVDATVTGEPTGDATVTGEPTSDATVTGEPTGDATVTGLAATAAPAASTGKSKRGGK